jgi:hypothetical protein
LQGLRSGIEVNGMQEVAPIMPLGLVGSALLVLLAPGPFKLVGLIALLGVG